LTSISKTTYSLGEHEYSALSTGTGNTVILLHGFPDTADSFIPLMTELSKKNHHVVAPNLRGYESTSLVQNEDYYLDSIVDDIKHLIDEIGTEPVHLVGHDWGATIAFGVAAKYPDKTKSLTMLSVPHPGQFQEKGITQFRQLMLSSYIIFFQLKGISEWFIRKNDFSYIDKLWKKWSPNLKDIKKHTQKLKNRLIAKPEILSAMLTYYRQAVDNKSEMGLCSKELSSAKIKVPTLGITGNQDGCICADIFKQCMHEDSFLKGIDVLEIDNVGHFLQLEAPNAVANALNHHFNQ